MTSCIVSTNSKSISGFSPRNIPECALWLDGADASSMTLSGSTVTQWNDKSGNGRNTTSATGTPTLTGNSLNSRSGVYFNGSANMEGPFVYTSNVLTYFIVSTTESDVANYGRTFTIGTSGVNDYDNAGSMVCLQRVTAGNILVIQRNNNDVGNTAGTQPYTTPFLLSGLVDGTNVTGFLNGTQFGSFASSGNFNTAIYRVSNGIQATNFRNKGFIYEILVYTSALTNDQRRAVEGYLAQKWGLTTNLPATHLYKTQSLFTRLFQPTDIGACALWMDAADTSTMTLSGTNITQWNDKSGNNYAFTQAGSFALPTFSSTGIASKGAVSIGGNGGSNDLSNQLLTNATFALNSSADGYSIFVVAVQNASAPSFTGYNYLLGSVGANGLLFGAGGTPRYLVTVNGTAGPSYGYNDLNANVPNTSLTTVFQASMIVNGSVLAPYINGTAMTTKVGTCVALTGLNIGNAYLAGQNYTGQTWGGLIGEILIYNAALTNIQRQQVEGYLAWKWGLQGNLPSGQPFKLFRTPTPVFNPLQVGALALWLDASDLSTITSATAGSSVTRWNDKSGNGLSALIGNYSLPTFNVSTNGKPYVNFGVNQSMFVANFPYNVTWNVFVAMNTTTLAGRWFISPYDVFSLVMMGFNNNKIFDMMATQTDLSGEHIENTSAVNTNGTGGYFWFRDGTQGATTSATRALAATTLTLGIGANGRNTDPLVGSGSVIRVYEILIYSGTTATLLTTSQRQQVEGYLAWKWGLQRSLPAVHPFSKSRP